MHVLYVMGGRLIRSRMRLIDAQDLLQDPIVEFQHRYFLPLAIGNGIILPAVIAHFGWNDFWGGFLYGGYVARVLIWHVTFCINRYSLGADNDIS